MVHYAHRLSLKRGHQMNHDGNIWLRPRAKISLRGDGNINRLEERFEASFIGGFPVILASARAGIMLTLKNFHTSQNISLFPYASQCVVRAAYLAKKTAHTPLPNQPREIIYNQWGLHQNQDIKFDIFLEDSADSFYPLGGKVCKTNSRFEVWSLPKILGITFGGIVWCKNQSDAMKLREIRSNLPKQNLLIRSLLSTSKTRYQSTFQLWENYEFSHPAINNSQVKILNNELNKWNATYAKRLSEYQIAVRKISQTTFPNSDALDFINYGVIPTVIDSTLPMENESVRELNRVYPNGKVIPTYVYPYQIGTKS